MNKIGIIGAMELEVDTIKSHLTEVKVTKKANMEFYEGTLNKAAVVVVKCGIGKVNAGICVQILADKYNVTHVINTGVAGSLSAELDIGDIVVSTDTVYHDMDVTVFGYALGEVPQLGVKTFAADEDMVKKAVASCEKMNSDIHVITGRVASGDQFISSAEVKNKIIADFGASCAEMEGAAIGQTAFLNTIPFVIIRAISDKADDSAEEDYPTFERKAAEHCAKLVEDFVTQI